MKILSLALVVILSVAAADDIWLGEKFKSGVIPLNKGRDDMFYWFFDSHKTPETDPIVMWLSGGPGCSSQIASMFENGPLTFNKDGSLNKRPETWNTESNLLFVDNPIGTGYSHANDNDYVLNEKEIAQDMLQFIQGFIAKFPEFKGRDFYITGESYAGHYIPAIAHYFLIHAKEVPVNLKGIAIGNGWVDPYHQYPAYAEFAYSNKLIGKTQYLAMKTGFKGCQAMIKKGWSMQTFEYCQLLMMSVIGSPLDPAFNLYDIRKKCGIPPMCYDFSHADTFFNRKDVMESLNVPAGRDWTACDFVVHTFLIPDWLNSMSHKMSDITESGMNVLVYSGDKDFVCNWMGGLAWSKAVEWEGQKEFDSAPFQEWTVGSESAGALKQHKNFKFLRVYNAGHMVPMDQPLNSLAMLHHFINDSFPKQEAL